MTFANKIDIHAHVSLPHKEQKGMLTVKKQLEYYRDLGIKQGIILPLLPKDTALHQTVNREYAAFCAENPEQFDWFCNLDPTCFDIASDKLGDQLAAYKALGAKGVGEMTANIYFDDARMENLLYHCGELDLPLLIHISPGIGISYGVVDELHLPRIAKMLQKYPKLTLFGHSQAFWSEISGENDEYTRDKNLMLPYQSEGVLFSMMREYPNLFCDLSANSGMFAFCRQEDHAIRFLNEFSDRICFGCDMTPGVYDQTPKLIAQLDKYYQSGAISEEVYRKLAFENAQRLFSL